MNRYGPPDNKDPKRYAGLTQRRKERGLPVGKEGMPPSTAKGRGA